MNKIAVFGAGGFGREVQNLIEDINLNSPQYEFIGYYDDGLTKGKIINGYPVLGGMDDLNMVDYPLCIAMAVGNCAIKRSIVSKIDNKNISFPSLIHPNVLIGNMQYNSIGKGCIICAGVIITVNIDIKDFVIINLSCTVGHDTTIGNFCSFMPTVNISGEVVIGDEVYFGTGAKIINQLTIGKKSTIGSGAVVVRDLPEECTAVGVPAKVIKINSVNNE